MDLATRLRAIFGDLTGLGDVMYADSPGLSYGTAADAFAPRGTARYNWLLSQQPQWEVDYARQSLANPNLTRPEFIAGNWDEFMRQFQGLSAQQRGEQFQGYRAAPLWSGFSAPGW